MAEASSIRSVQLRNAHPHLRVPRAAVARVIALLDAEFRMLPGDLPHLSLPPARLRSLRTQISNLTSANHPANRTAPSPVPSGELSIVFLTDPAIAQIHADFMADPTATDVITFEGDATAGLAGEICVSADTAAAYAREHGHDFATELTLYVVHGWLHLAGYDDLAPTKKRRMRAAEARALKLLAAADALPAFRLNR